MQSWAVVGYDVLKVFAAIYNNVTIYASDLSRNI
jgi:hypothetical protein